MNTAAQVDSLFEGWKKDGLTKEQLIVKTAQAEIGWPYGWGAVASLCTPSKRKYYSERSACPERDAENLVKRCQVLSGKSGKCSGCQFYPGGETGLNDCQGFVKEVFLKVGISFSGGGCTSMWNTDSNWKSKGPISEIPNQVCLVFQRDPSDSNKMQHVGIYIGGWQIIECATTVRPSTTSKTAWTHYAVPKGLGGDTPMPTHATIRRGSTGADVVKCQQDLIQLGYDLSPYGADGKFGAKTEKAVKQFQAASGLKADGIVGPMTWEALDAAVKPGGTLYTVTIRHASKAQADALKAQYPGAEVQEEVG